MVGNFQDLTSTIFIYIKDEKELNNAVEKNFSYKSRLRGIINLSQACHMRGESIKGRKVGIFRFLRVMLAGWEVEFHRRNHR
jgi:hypothetical protein